MTEATESRWASKLAAGMAVVDRQLPRGLDADEVILGRLVLSCALALAVWGPPFTGLTWWLGAPHVAGSILAATVSVLATPLVIRGTGSVRAGMAWILAALLGVLVGSSVWSGGTLGPALFWLPALPLLAQMTGSRGGFAGTVATGGSFLALGLAEVAGFPFRQEFAPGAFDLYWVACGVSIAPVMWSLGLLWDATNQRMRREALAAKAEAQAAHRGARLVLDSVDQGLAIVERDGRLRPESSAALHRMLGEVRPGERVWELLGRVDPAAGELARLGWDALSDGFLPVELVLAQLPSRVACHGHAYRLSFAPVAGSEPDRPSAIVFVVTDVTEVEAREHAEREHRDQLSAFLHHGRDARGFAAFVSEGDAIVGRLGAGGDPATLRRELHTLKGSAGLFGLQLVVETVHAVESELAESGGAPDTDQRARVAAAWERFRRSVAALLERDASVLPLPRSEYGRVLTAARSGIDPAWIAEQMVAWTWDDADARLHHLGDAAVALAGRLGRAPLRLRVEASGLRTAPALAPLWTVLSHLVRNAVDHGIEPAEEREAAGKPASGTLALRARLDDHLRLEIGDDGRGVAWDRLRDKAAARGLPHATPDDLVQALFADGVSSRDEATEISGRGVGMGAVRAVVHDLGGAVHVRSAPGRGATFVLDLPARLALDPALPAVDDARVAQAG